MALPSQRYAFEPFDAIDGILRGEPIRVFPQGKWHRDDRVLDISEQRLRAFAANFKAGLPRFRVPFNLDHADGQGKVGTVLDADYLPDGPKGPGLYATRYEFTEKGKKAVIEDGYDAVSGEAVWTLYGGATYQDPETGQRHDNVLVGVALTPKPFFGHNNVALFSADKGYNDMNAPMSGNPMQDQDGPDRQPGLMQRLKGLMQQMIALMNQANAPANPDTPPPAQPNAQPPHPAGQMNAVDLIAIDGFKDYGAEMRREMAAKGWAMSDGSYPIADGGDLMDAIHRVGSGNAPQGQIKAHIVQRAKALGMTDKLPTEWSRSTRETAASAAHTTEDDMANNQTAAETFQVKAEEFQALKEKAAKVDELSTQNEKFAAKINDLEKSVSTERRARELDQMVAHAEAFVALPGKPADLGENLLRLKEADPKLFEFFDGLLQTADKQLVQSDLFGQKTHEHRAESSDTLEALTDRIVADKFGGDKTKYSDALRLASVQRPDLARQYVMRE